MRSKALLQSKTTPATACPDASAASSSTTSSQTSSAADRLGLPAPHAETHVVKLRARPAAHTR
eukprot:4543576-Lingulodinium_polyedra.AAC.1